MPVVIVDTEQADLMEAAFVMLEAALTARTARADPDKVISNSLNLQALKLKTVRTLLRQPDPLKWSELPREGQERIIQVVEQLKTVKGPAHADQLYERLRGLLNAAPLPRA